MFGVFLWKVHATLSSVFWDLCSSVVEEDACVTPLGDSKNEILHRDYVADAKL